MFSSFRAAGASIRLEHHLCPAALEPPTDAAPRAPKDASAGVFAVHTGIEPRGRLAPHAVAFMALAQHAGVAKSPDAIATLAGVLAVDPGREFRKRSGHGRAPRHSSEGAFALDTGPAAVAPEDPSAARTNSVSHDARVIPRRAPDARGAFSLDAGTSIRDSADADAVFVIAIHPTIDSVLVPDVCDPYAADPLPVAKDCWTGVSTRVYAA